MTVCMSVYSVYIRNYSKGTYMVNNRKIIALCTSSIYDAQVFGFIKTLNETLKSTDSALLVFSINSDIYWDESLVPAETYVFDIMPYDELDCIILMDEKIKSHTVSNRILSKAKESDTPVIVIDGEYEGTTTVGFDYDIGFEAITRHVIEYHKVKRPHMMAGFADNIFSNRRIEVFKKVLAENNIPFDSSMISHGDFWADPTRAAMAELLKRDVLPDAIICANDIMAINVSDMLQLDGKRVPEDVIVSGFDGYEEAFYSKPKISTSSCDTMLLAESAGRLALDAASGKEIKDLLIPPRLVPNESCGCQEHSWNALHQMASFNNSFYRHQDDSRILYNISSAMEISNSTWDMAAAIHNHKTKYSLTVVDRNIFDMDSNYFTEDPSNWKAPDFHIINDADYAEEHRFDGRFPLPEDLFYDTEVNPKADVLSGNYRDRIIELMDLNIPLVFNALDYMNRPFGFNCYFYEDYAVTDYSRTAIVTNGISMGIGGFINLQYQKRLMEKMDDMYKHDALTGLYNRLGFLRIYDITKNDEENHGKEVTVIMSDLDGLKYINDTYGHADGDSSITAVGNALKESCPENALCARYGGDELFAVILGKCDPDSIIRNIDSILDDYNKKAANPYLVTTSSGTYTTTFNPEFDLNKALKIADERMYAVKSEKIKNHLYNNQRQQ